MSDPTVNADASDQVSGADREILRNMARRVAEIAAMPIMADRRRLWRGHNALRPERAMILIFPEGSWRELMPPSALRCEGKEARYFESQLYMRIYEYEHFDHDKPVDADWIVGKVIRSSGWGISAQWRPSDDPTGARAFDPVILDPADLKKIRMPEITFDEKATHRELARQQDLFGDILDVKLRGVTHVSFHLMNQYTALRGLAEVMMDMIENPGMLHEAMSLLEQGHQRIIRQYVEQNLLSLNNDGTYHSSGGVGYTDELPQADCDPEHVRPCDMWASAEAQELAQVSPQMHEEFSLAYERRLMAPFGLNGYGCCEDLTRKLDDVLTIPNIRRISISPWADVQKCAEKLGGRYIFSWKPHPAHLVGAFNPEKIRDYIRHALEATRGCVFEMILKDTHTCDHCPQRFDEWTRIARELVDEIGEK
jgi:hypothetical protein